MTYEQTIIAYATSHDGIVVRKDFFAWLKENYPKASSSSYDVVMRQMIAKGLLQRIGRGIMGIVSSQKKIYLPKLNPEMLNLYMKLKEDYPYTEMCIWPVSSISSFVQHVPFSNTLILDTEKLSTEAVFHSVKHATPRIVLLNPTQKEYDLYSSHEGNLIVKPLITEAPTIEGDGVTMASLEKILVDIAIDPTFSFASGNELNTIYENAFDMYEINTKTMLRYASRRGKKEEIQKLINDVTI